MILCVSLTGCYPIASYRCSCFQLPVEAQLVILKISWFVFNPKQADLHPRLPTSPTLRIAAQKQTLRPPAGWRDGPQNPHGSAHPVSGLVGNAKWMQWSGSLRATSVILSHLPAKKGGWEAQQGPEGGMSRAVGENPSAYRVVGLNESHHRSGYVCQDLTMWPGEEQTGQEIEVNNIVTC